MTPCRRRSCSGARSHSFAASCPARIQWGDAFQDPKQQVRKLVIRRASAAGLGHVAPHDLRRTTAGILHRSIDANGKHDFDLLDIQRVLDHASIVLATHDVADEAARDAVQVAEGIRCRIIAE